MEIQNSMINLSGSPPLKEIVQRIEVENHRKEQMVRQAEMQMTRVNQGLEALLFLISSKGSKKKQGNIVDVQG